MLGVGDREHEQKKPDSPITSIFISIALTFLAEFTMRLGGLRVDGKSTHLLAHTLHSPICWTINLCIKTWIKHVFSCLPY